MAKSFGERLRMQRNEKHLTIKQVADHIGVSPRMYTRYESDESEPDRKRLTPLAEILGWHPSLLSIYLTTDAADPQAEADALLSYIESADFLRNVDKAKMRAIVERALEDAVDIPQIAERRARYTTNTKPQVVGLAGDKNDLNLPENQKLLQEMADEDAN
jgi:transcriptional regulator with XRE-family HTH domain